MDVKILLVEDEVSAGELIQRVLVGLGYQVPEVVASGEEAIRAAYEHHPALVLMDVALHGAIDGIQAATALQNLLHLPVVYVTGCSDEETIARASATQPYGYLMKPLDVRALRGTIEVALHRHAVDRRRADRELCYATMLESIEEAVIAADRRGGIIFMNKAAEAVTGWPRSEALGVPLRDVLRLFLGEHDPPSPAATRDLVARSLRSAPMLLDRSRRWVVMDARSLPILDEEGEVQGGVIVFHDFTPQMGRDLAPNGNGDPGSRRLPDAAPPRRGRVLVVDAESQVAQAMARILGREHEVFLEIDGEAALGRLTQGEEFDIVFCDLSLPGLSGIDIYESLAGERPEIAARLVFLIASDTTPDSRRFLSSIPNVSLSKPFATESLRALVREHLR